MTPVTQADIDEAVIIAKVATYKLAYELSLEEKYGGDISCCMTKLKLIWMYKNALSCQMAQTDADGSIQIISCSAGDTINIFIGGINIGGPYICTSSSVSAQMSGLINLINLSQTIYVATLTGSGNIKFINVNSNSCENSTITAKLTTRGMTLPVLSLIGFSGGYCSYNNCLSDDKIKKLIAKIKRMCISNN